MAGEVTNNYVGGKKHNTMAHKALKPQQIQALFISAGWVGDAMCLWRRIGSNRKHIYDKGPGVLA